MSLKDREQFIDQTAWVRFSANGYTSQVPENIIYTHAGPANLQESEDEEYAPHYKEAAAEKENISHSITFQPEVGTYQPESDDSSFPR